MLDRALPLASPPVIIEQQAWYIFKYYIYSARYIYSQTYISEHPLLSNKLYYVTLICIALYSAFHINLPLKGHIRQVSLYIYMYILDLIFEN